MATDVHTLPAELPAPPDDDGGVVDVASLARARAHLWYPVFPPGRNVGPVLAWLRTEGGR